MSAKGLPFKISIASPCPARWADMGGGDQVRYCDLCKKNVYNLSAMSAEAAAALVAEKKGGLCARIYQRPDGTVLTEDCPVGLARHWRTLKKLVAGGVAAILFTAVYARALGSDKTATGSSGEVRYRVTAALDDAVWTVKGWFGVKRPVMLMGAIAIRSPQSNANGPVDSSTPQTETAATSGDK